MILAIDIGNTNIVLGGFRGGPVKFLARMTTDRHMEADQYAVQLQGIFELYDVDKVTIEGIVLSSVVPGVTEVMLRALRHFTPVQPVLLNLQLASPLTVDIENPAELGMDLLASAIAVQAGYPLPAVIIDMGTATKLIAIDSDSKLRGVSIAPGLYVSLEALVGNASLLRGIALSAPPAAIGRNSTQSMQSGIVLGNACMIDGLIDKIAEEMGGLQSIVATGGAAPVVIPHCRHNIKFVDTLILDGLLLAYQRAQ